jgi:hypothetical protein
VFTPFKQHLLIGGVFTYLDTNTNALMSQGPTQASSPQFCILTKLYLDFHTDFSKSSIILKMYLKVKHCELKKDINLCIANGADNPHKLSKRGQICKNSHILR